MICLCIFALRPCWILWLLQFSWQGYRTAAAEGEHRNFGAECAAWALKVGNGKSGTPPPPTASSVCIRFFKSLAQSSHSLPRFNHFGTSFVLFPSSTESCGIYDHWMHQSQNPSAQRSFCKEPVANGSEQIINKSALVLYTYPNAAREENSTLEGGNVGVATFRAWFVPALRYQSILEVRPKVRVLDHQVWTSWAWDFLEIHLCFYSLVFGSLWLCFNVLHSCMSFMWACTDLYSPFQPFVLCQCCRQMSARRPWHALRMDSWPCTPASCWNMLKQH